MALPVGHPRIFDVADVPSRWPTSNGDVNPTPHLWRFNTDELEAVDCFWRDVLWALEDDWRQRPHSLFSGLAIARHIARLWGLPSAERPLPRRPEPDRGTRRR
jgi:hypothetical protein